MQVVFIVLAIVAVVLFVLSCVFLTRYTVNNIRNSDAIADGQEGIDESWGKFFFNKHSISLIVTFALLLVDIALIGITKAHGG